MHICVCEKIKEEAILAEHAGEHASGTPCFFLVPELRSSLGALHRAPSHFLVCLTIT